MNKPSILAMPNWPQTSMVSLQTRKDVPPGAAFHRIQDGNEGGSQPPREGPKESLNRPMCHSDELGGPTPRTGRDGAPRTSGES